MKRFELERGTSMAARAMAGSLLLASSVFFTSGHAEPIVTGPLSVDGSLVVLGPVTVDGSLTVAGNISARGPITVGGDVGTVGTVGAEGPITQRR
ncbi:hypothetical protein WS51_02040 [Burkholderia territorii]|uniref:hypothetical protein n=1 Tax=Burkholderia territorii TaxID=1503055 RepID=UPI000841EB87|nr:hypothetical protein [Burkholderia territorii]AOI62454.1 hypothetical protein WS51_02040 [Burkholderia territorii]